MDWIQTREKQIIEEIDVAGDTIADLANPVVYKKSVIDKYGLSTITVDFDNISVRPHFKNNPNAQSVWIEYTVPFTGERQLLSINSGARVAQVVSIDATIVSNAFTFSTFTGYHRDLTLPTAIEQRMNANLIAAREYVEAEVNHINSKIVEFNDVLAEFVATAFDDKKAAIEAKRKSADRLNPFKKQ